MLSVTKEDFRRIHMKLVLMFLTVMYRNNDCGEYWKQKTKVVKEMSVHENQKHCIVCRREKRKGITICNEFICRKCEQEMVHTEVHDDKYSFFIQQMRSIWLQKNA